MARRDPRALWAAVLLSVAACDRPLPDPSISDAPSCQRYFQRESPQYTYRYALDVLFVIDNSPAMAALSPTVAERMEQLVRPVQWLVDFGSTVDLQFGVITADRGFGPRGTPTCRPASEVPPSLLISRGSAAPPSCQAPRGANWIHFDNRPGNPFPNNLPDGQSLAQTLSCMAAVGTRGCEVSQPLEAAYQALRDPRNAGFLREDASLLLVFITATDDRSTSPDGSGLLPTDRYSGWLQFDRLSGGVTDSPLDVGVVTLRGPCKAPPFTAAPSPRLDAVAASVKQSSASLVCDADWSPVLDRPFQPINLDWFPPCVRYQLDEPIQSACRAFDETWHRDGTITRAELPSCGPGMSRPCFTLERDPVCTAFGLPGLRFDVRREWFGAPPHTATIFDCIGPCGDGGVP